jgi:hypothetical protein
MDIKQARENREKFLAPYKEKFKKTESKKERSKTILDLIAIEPSHLTEPWILKEVVGWMRDRKFFDFLEEVFVQAPKKYAETEKQKFKQARDFFVQHKIDQIIAKEGVSVRKACLRLAGQISSIMDKFEDDKFFGHVDMSNFEGDKYLGFDLIKEYEDGLELAIRRVYLDAKKKPERSLPWPYYGKDLEEDENGNVMIFGGR